MTYIIIFITAVVSIACFRNRAYVDRLSMNPYRIAHNREWYRLVTHGFVHADYTHLIVNMLVLWSFGIYMESLFKAYAHAGSISVPVLHYFALYFGGMIAASIYDLIKYKDNPRYSSIGASGAASAVVFASIFFNPWNKIYFFGVILIPGIIFGVLYIVYSQYMGKRGNGVINHNAHLFGTLFGFLYPIFMNSSFLRVFLDKITDI